MKKSYKSGTNVKIEIIFTFFKMRRLVKSRIIVEFAKKKLKIKNKKYFKSRPHFRSHSMQYHTQYAVLLSDMKSYLQKHQLSFFVNIFLHKAKTCTLLARKFDENSFRHLAAFNDFFLSHQNIFVKCTGTKKNCQEFFVIKQSLHIFM